MELYEYFKAVLEQNNSVVVICNLNHEILYMNPKAKERYAAQGGEKLIGKSLLNCHNPNSNNRIHQIIEWFEKSPENNRVYTSYNPRENKDVYTVALRNEDGKLIGYYEKQEYRNNETCDFYTMD